MKGLSIFKIYFDKDLLWVYIQNRKYKGGNKGGN